MSNTRPRLLEAAITSLIVLAVPLLTAPSYPSITPGVGPRITVTTVDDATGVVMPARLRVETLASSSMPASLRPEPFFATSEGTVSIPGAREPVRITATCGPEFRPTAVVLREGNAITLRLVRVLDPRGYVPVDLHVHTDASPDGHVSARDRSSALAAEGIRFAIATDHNAVTTLPEKPTLATAKGVEVTTWAPEIGHFNVFPVRAAPEYRARTARELFADLHRDPDVVIIANHPRLEDHIAYFGLAGLDAEGRVHEGFSLDFDALEVWNGYDLARPARVDRVFAEWLALVARGHSIAAIGASDSHRATGQWVGYPRTMVRLGEGEGIDGVNVARAVRAGRTFVTSGPMLFVSVGAKGPGESVGVSRDAMIDLDIRVEAPPSMALDTLEIFAGTACIRTIPLRPRAHVVAFDERVRVFVANARTLVVRVRGHGTLAPLVDRRGAFPMAFTSPIHLETWGENAD